MANIRLFRDKSFRSQSTFIMDKSVLKAKGLSLESGHKVSRGPRGHKEIGIQPRPHPKPNTIADTLIKEVADTGMSEY